jgi:hypothetical protein
MKDLHLVFLEGCVCVCQNTCILLYSYYTLMLKNKLRRCTQIPAWKKGGRIKHYLKAAPLTSLNASLPLKGTGRQCY